MNINPIIRSSYNSFAVLNSITVRVIVTSDRNSELDVEGTIMTYG